MSNEYVKGQLIQLSIRESNDEDAWWEYGVIVNVFDDRVEILRESGHRFMYRFIGDGELFKNQPTKFEITILRKDGKIFMAKKSLFRKYKFKPQN